MKLIKYEGYKLDFEPQLLAINVFKKMHDRDKSVDKHNFISELCYIYFMEDSRSDYQYIINRNDRKKAVVEGEGLPKNFKEDKLLQEAIKYYNSFKASSVLLLEDTRAMIDKYRETLRNIEFKDLDVKDLKEIGNIIKQVPILIKDLDEAEKTIAKELSIEERIRGGKEKSMYEDL